MKSRDRTFADNVLHRVTFAAGLALASTVTTSAVDVALTKRALEHLRSRRRTEANDVKNSIGDPVAKKLVEWLILRSDDAGVDFSRYAAFIASSPGWPSMSTLRRKAEALLFQVSAGGELQTLAFVNPYDLDLARQAGSIVEVGAANDVVVVIQEGVALEIKPTAGSKF